MTNNYQIILIRALLHVFRQNEIENLTPTTISFEDHQIDENVYFIIILLILNNFEALYTSQQQTLLFSRTTRLRKITRDFNDFLVILMFLKVLSPKVE